MFTTSALKVGDTVPELPDSPVGRPSAYKPIIDEFGADGQWVVLKLLERGHTIAKKPTWAKDGSYEIRHRTVGDTVIAFGRKVTQG